MILMMHGAAMKIIGITLEFKHNIVSELLYICILFLKVCKVFCESY